MLWSSSARLQAQTPPTIVSSVPANGATGVSLTAPLVFTFSTAMEPDLTSVTVFSATTFPTFKTSWSADSNVLTLTPNLPLAANTTYQWIASGEDQNGNQMADPSFPFPTFSTATGSGGGETGHGTNQTTSFVLGKQHSYVQLSTAPSTLVTDSPPFNFIATAVMASNRVATAVNLVNPSSGSSAMTRNIVSLEDFYMLGSSTNLGTFEQQFPSGSYSFKVMSNTVETLAVALTLPSDAQMPQPNAPHLKDFASLQAVDASKPLPLTWDAFQGGGASDVIWVDVGGIYNTPNPGEPGALTGTATSVTIPAGILPPNTTNLLTIGFYRANFTTNAASNYGAAAYKATVTTVDLITITTSTNAPPPGLTSVGWGAKGLIFEISGSPGAGVVVDFSNNLQAGGWSTLVTTNILQTGKLQLADQNPTGSSRFYRAKYQ